MNNKVLSFLTMNKLNNLINKLTGKVQLPTTFIEYDNLITTLMNKYGFTDRDHTSAIVSVAIRHLDNSVSITSYSYLGSTVKKNLANYIANYKSETLKHEAQIQSLVDMLVVDPNNMQALDALTVAAREGSQQARAALVKLGATPIATPSPIEPPQA